MALITDEMRDEVRDTIINYFAEECEVDKEKLSDATNVIEEIGGDSLMFLELLSVFIKKYNLNVELKSVGKYVLKNPTETIGQFVDTTMLVIEHENNIANL